MKILDKYIQKQLFSTIAVVSVCLLGLDLFFYFINEVRFIGKGDYNLSNALYYILLTIDAISFLEYLEILLLIFLIDECKYD